MPSSQIAPQTVFVEWKSLMALKDVPVYQGNPGDTQIQVTTIASGQMALVTGASSDGKWWRVVCPDDTVGNCWVSSSPDLTEPRTAPTSGPVYPWIKLRDARYGYGIAIPCYWSVIPTPSQGNYAAMTIRSYDDAYFMAHSEKGGWVGGKRPEGAVSMDMVVIEGIQPTLALTEAVRQIAASDINVIQSIEPITLGTNTGVLADVQGTQGPRADPPGPNNLVYFRLAPDKVLMVAALPTAALASADVQGILSSLVLSKQQDMALPDFAPAPPLGEAPPACRP
jgi:hypothetical protein